MTRVDALALVGGAAVVVSVSMLGALGAAEAHRRLFRRAPGLPEVALGLFGLIGTASVLTVGLLLAWRVPFDAVEMSSLASPSFVAALLGTLGGHLAILAWAVALGATLGLERASARWFAVAVAGGGGAVLLSAGWTLLAELAGRTVEDQELVRALMSSPAGPARALVLLFVVVLAPVLEELVFRGYVQTAVSARLGAWPAIGISAVLFGLFHLSDPHVVPVLTSVGVGLGWLRHRCGSVVPPILAHVLNNTLAMILAFA